MTKWIICTRKRVLSFSSFILNFSHVCKRLPKNERKMKVDLFPFRLCLVGDMFAQPSLCFDVTMPQRFGIEWCLRFWLCFSHHNMLFLLRHFCCSDSRLNINQEIVRSFKLRYRWINLPLWVIPSQSCSTNLEMLKHNGATQAAYLISRAASSFYPPFSTSAAKTVFYNDKVV